MKESTLRKLILLLMIGAIVSLFWAIGANSRKKVELKKSETLESKLNKLILANTAIVNDLKAARNRLAALQQSERLLKKNLAIATKKNEEMKETIEKATSSAFGTSKSIEDMAKEAAILKNTNTALGKEILTLKEKEVAFRLEIEKLKSQLKQTAESTPRKKNPVKRKQKKEKNNLDTDNLNRNFTWQ